MLSIGDPAAQRHDVGAEIVAGETFAAALAALADDAPIIVHVASENDPKAVYDEIITSAGAGNVGWGDGYGMERTRSSPWSATGIPRTSCSSARNAPGPRRAPPALPSPARYRDSPIQRAGPDRASMGRYCGRKLTAIISSLAAWR